MSTFQKASRRIAALLAVAVVAYALLWLATRSIESSSEREELFNRTDRQSQTISDLETELAGQEATSAALAQQIKSLGQVPIVEPTPPPSSTTTVSPSFSFIQRLVDIGVAARCGGGSCVGSAGPPGAPGLDGANGTNGTTPSDERLLALITPLIPAPVPGAPGANGADGRGIASLWCTSAVSFEYVVTYTDGTTQTVSCGPAPPIDPPVEVLP